MAAAEFVYDLPQGLDTPCGELGSGLSEGQCQRLAIARALLCRGGVLVLDESTSSLDGATEARLLRNLKNLAESGRYGKFTVIFISHRESVMESANKIIRL